MIHVSEAMDKLVASPLQGIRQDWAGRGLRTPVGDKAQLDLSCMLMWRLCTLSLRCVNHMISTCPNKLNQKKYKKMRLDCRVHELQTYQVPITSYQEEEMGKKIPLSAQYC